MKFNVLILLTIIGAAYGTQVIDICSHDKDGKFYGDFSSCSNYIACVNGNSVFGTCPDGLLFNTTESMCNYASQVKCQQCPRSGIEYYPMQGSCSRYIRCIAGAAEYFECPTGFFFDKTSSSCNYKEKVDCEESICQYSGEYIVPSHESCTDYFWCQNGIASRGSCNQGLYYNDANKQCDDPSNVQCNIIPPKQPELADVLITCPPTGTHFYPHPANCGHYFICVNGANTLLNCGPALHYDFERELCDTPSNTKCIVNYL